MSKTDNLHDYLSDLAEAIREKKGTQDPINAQSFADEIRGIESGNGWTGHADVEGLKAIGWDDEDIAYYQRYGVNWNEEDDQYHLVSDDNKALYGVLTADNIADYKDRIVYLPKIDTNGVTSMQNKFKDCVIMIAIPHIDCSSVTNMSYMFSGCYALVSISPMDTSKATNMANMFAGCYSLITIPQLDTQRVTNMTYMFNSCFSLRKIPPMNTSNVLNMSYMFLYCESLVEIPPMDTSKVTNMAQLFNRCYSLVTTPQLDTSKVTNNQYIFSYTYSITKANIKNLTLSLSVSAGALLSKESLLYMIENEAATEAITITLHSYAYSRLAEDADIVAALANHPLVSLASA